MRNKHMPQHRTGWKRGLAAVGVAALAFGVVGVGLVGPSTAQAAKKTTKKSAKVTKPAAKKAPAAAKAAVAGAAALGVYPDADVVNLATSKAVNLTSLASEAKPTLVFIWGPS
jgi:hypothetical protein